VVIMAAIVFVVDVSGVSVRAMGVIVMLDLVAARIAGMRPENSDQAGENGTQQRQENNRLNH
jgi:hypothetical protein